MVGYHKPGSTSIQTTLTLNVIDVEGSARMFSVNLCPTTTWEMSKYVCLWVIDKFSSLQFEIFAGRGSSLDYTLNTDQISISPDMEASVVITLRVDDIALEEQETLQLRLDPVGAQPPSDGTFCIAETTLTILDSDSKFL